MEDILFNSDLIIFRSDAKERDEVFAPAAELLEAKGCVRGSFLDALREREKNFPTGVPAHDINVAIPHAESDHVIRSSILAATLRNPVKFGSMTDKNEQIDVGIVLVLALNDSGTHLNVLKNVMQVVQNRSTIEALLQASDRDQVYRTLAPIILNPGDD